MKKSLIYILTTILMITFAGNNIGLRNKKVGKAADDYFQLITVNDFMDDDKKEMKSSVYEFESHAESLAIYELKDTEKKNFDKTKFSAKLKFEYDRTQNLGGYETRIHVGGSSSWKGLAVYAEPSGNVLRIKDLMSRSEDKIQDINLILDKNVAGVSSFFDTEFLLEMTFEFLNYDEEKQRADLLLGILINGKLYNNAPFFFTDCNMGNVGTRLELYREHISSAIYMCSSREEKFPTKMPKDSFDKVTFFHFNLNEEVYKRTAHDVVAEGMYKMKSSLNETVLCGDVLLDGTGEHEFQMMIGGSLNSKAHVWAGMRLVTRPDGTMQLWAPEAGNYAQMGTLRPDVAGVKSFVGEMYRLMISSRVFDYHNDGNANDLQVGIWFNDVLYDNSYFVLENCGTNWGNMFGVYVEKEGESVTLKNVDELTKLPDDRLSKVTFDAFDIDTGIYYESDGAIIGKAKEFEQADGVAFGGIFRFSEKGDYEIQYGNSLNFEIKSNDIMNVTWGKGAEKSDICTILPAQIGAASFFKDSFLLMISTEIVQDDVALKLWFNENPYQWGEKKQFVIAGAGSDLGNRLEICCDTPDTAVYIRDYQAYLENIHYYEDISPYRLETGFLAPETPEGYFFAGWYEDCDYRIPVSVSKRNGPAWAKFTEEEVLTVKAQVKLQDGAVSDKVTSLRLITTVDSLQYQEVSFRLSKTEGKWSDIKNNKIVYEKLNYLDYAGEQKHYLPTIFSWMSKYFYTCVINGIPASDYDDELRIVPYWITLDWTLVCGKEKVFRVNDYLPPKGQNHSNAVSFEFLGADVMPISGFFGPHIHRYGYGESDYLLPNYNTELYYKTIADAGVNLMVYADADYKVAPKFALKQLELCEKYGIGVFVKDSGLFEVETTAELSERLSVFQKYNSFCGMYIIDEPQVTNPEASNYLYRFEQSANLLKELGVDGYANLLPITGYFTKESYLNYVREFGAVMDLGYLSWDFYPFDPWRNGDLGLYFWNMDAIRSEALENDDAFWAVIQAGSQWNDGSSYFESSTPYYPSRSQFMWNVNTCLAFGAQAIEYFPLVQPIHFAYGADETKWDFERNGIIGAWGNKTQWYGFAKEINKHISTIDHVLMNSHSEGILVSGAKAISETKDVSCILNAYKELRAITSGNALVGCFDYEGRTAFYVVNYNMYDQNDTAIHGNDEIVLQFEQACDLRVIQKEVERKCSTDERNRLVLSMEAGEGVLIVVE